MNEKRLSTNELVKYLKGSFDYAWHEDVEFVTIITKLRNADMLCEVAKEMLSKYRDGPYETVRKFRKTIANYEGTT